MTELNDVPDSATEAEYQSLSPLALVALILAILSPTALTTPLLLVIPTASIGAALLALSRINSSGGTLTGARMARGAMALAIACVVAPLVRDQVRDALMQRQTTAVAQTWLAQVAAGQITESKALISAQALASLTPRSEEPGTPAPDPKVVETVVLEKLRSDPLTRGLADFKTPLTITLKSPSVAPVFDGQRTLVSGVYQVESATDRQPLLVHLNFLRLAFFEKEGRPWRIDSWRIVDSVKSATTVQ